MQPDRTPSPRSTGTLSLDPPQTSLDHSPSAEPALDQTSKLGDQSTHHEIDQIDQRENPLMAETFEPNQDPAPELREEDVDHRDPELTEPSDPASTQPLQSNSSKRIGNFLVVLKNRNFLTLWSGQVFSQLADKIFLVLMIALIAANFQSQGESISRWVSSIMVAFTLPAILFGAIAGVYVDRWSKKLVLVGSNLLRGSFVLSIPIWLGVLRGQIWGDLPLGFLVLLLITFSVSTLTQYFAPAEQSTIPLIVPRPHLLTANALYTTTMMAALILGFAVGEPLLSLADYGIRQILPSIRFGPTLLVGGAYLLAGFILILLQTQEGKRVRQSVQQHVWTDLQEGWSYLKQAPLVRAAMLQLVILFSIFAALAVLAVRMAEVIPELGAAQFGVLLSSAGIGMAIGAALIGHSGSYFSRSAWGLYGSLGLSVTLIVMGWATRSLITTLILIGLLGLTGALVAVPMQTLIQEETPAALRGKVFGLQNNLVNIALSLPLVLAGVAETYWGLSPVLIGLGGLTGGAGVLIWSMVRRVIIQETTDQPNPQPTPNSETSENV